MLKNIAISTSSTAILFASILSATHANELPLPERAIVAQANAEPITIVDMLWLNPDGGGLEAAQEYFQQLGPIIERYDVTFNSSYRPVSVENGYLTAPDFIFTFTFGTIEDQQALGSDPELQDPDYAELIPSRNKIFNFDDRISFEVEQF